MSSWGNGKMSEAQKKQISDRMRGMFEKSYILTFDKEASIYKEEEILESPGQGSFGGWWGSFSAGPQYKNINRNQFIQDQDFFGRRFLITDSLTELEWTIGSETKQIGQYLCIRATTTKKVDNFDWRSMRGKRGNKRKKEDTIKDSTNVKSLTEDIEMPKTIDVIAWYTPQIPVNQGPGEFWGFTWPYS